MELLKRIQNDCLAARKAQQKTAASLLTTLLSDAASRSKKELRDTTDSDVTAAIKYFLKNARASYDLSKFSYNYNHRHKISVEIEILEKYVPKQGLVNVWAFLDKLVLENTDKFAETKKNPALLGWFVGQAMRATEGKADAGAVKEYLTNKEN